jgi:hypothetical protein
MLKLWVVLALACAGAPAATQVVILGTGTPRAEDYRGRVVSAHDLDLY